jgi:hypothetical protein
MKRRNMKFCFLRVSAADRSIAMHKKDGNQRVYVYHKFVKSQRRNVDGVEDGDGEVEQDG